MYRRQPQSLFIGGHTKQASTSSLHHLFTIALALAYRLNPYHRPPYYLQSVGRPTRRQTQHRILSHLRLAPAQVMVTFVAHSVAQTQWHVTRHIYHFGTRTLTTYGQPSNTPTPKKKWRKYRKMGISSCFYRSYIYRGSEWCFTRWSWCPDKIDRERGAVNGWRRAVAD